jgi:hypothetical protein
VFSALLWLLFGAADLTAQQKFTFPRDRLSRNTRDSVLRRPIPVIKPSGATAQAEVNSQGVELERDALAAIPTGEAVKTVTGPLAPPSAPAEQRGPGEFKAFGFRLLAVDATGTGAWVLRPVYKVANRLRWQADSSVFRGTIFLTVEDSARRNESLPLPAPVRFQLLGEADRVDPENIELRHTNFPLQRIDLLARRVADSLRVHLVPDFDVRGIDIWVPVEPSLIVETTPKTVQGWGVGNARVIVRVVGASSRAPASVSLAASEGELDTVAVTIGSAGTGTTRLRSGGAGLSTITASAPGFNDASTTIRFVAPIVFFGAALLGGVFGGLGAAAQRRKGRQRPRWREFAIKGVFTGLLAAVVWYALGVNLLQLDVGLPRFNELAVFAFAALAGFFGIPRLGARSEARAE